MTRFSRSAAFALLTLAALLTVAGCKSNPNTADNGQSAPADPSSDPASANLAPVSTDTSAAAPAPASPAAQQSTPAAPVAQQSAPAEDASGGGSQDSSAPIDDASYGEQPVETAPEPPPALPEYQQPPAPGDGYLWTPGYWSYASAGYYWVPGVWAQAPYQGALWTPGYWGWVGGHYGWFHGYWGPHIGFYGGVNYGYGYGGVGYQGGYWHGNNFYYNRTVNNINVNVIHNVYNYRVVENRNVRVSFNGGPSGLRVRPRPAELAAFREPHAPPMSSQVQVQHAAASDRANFAAVNHGRPANAVIARPVVADHDVRTVARPEAHNQPAAEHGGMQARPAPAPARHVEPNRPAPQRPESRPQAAPRAQPKPEEHAAPRPQAAPQQARPQQARPEQARPQQARPAPPRPEQHAAPAKPKPETRPAPRKEAPEKPRPEDQHPR